MLIRRPGSPSSVDLQAKAVGALADIATRALMACAAAPELTPFLLGDLDRHRFLNRATVAINIIPDADHREAFRQAIWAAVGHQGGHGSMKPLQSQETGSCGAAEGFPYLRRDIADPDIHQTLQDDLRAVLWAEIAIQAAEPGRAADEENLGFKGFMRDVLAMVSEEIGSAEAAMGAIREALDSVVGNSTYGSSHRKSDAE